MTRASRLDPVLTMAEQAERRAGEQLARAEENVRQLGLKLEELERYEREYRGILRQRAAEGIGAAGLRDFHVFLARLGEAVWQQGVLLERARTERDAERDRWRAAAQRVRAVGIVIEHAETEARREHERREQAETDERAQRAFLAMAAARAAVPAVRDADESPLREWGA
jgi:flagellar FliJ protein